MNKYLKGFYFVFFILISYCINSQPVLTGLQSNPVIKNYLKSHSNILIHTKSVIDTLQLPFFDDFAKPDIFPDSARWLDRFAYINDSYGDNPISIGVATLDILNDLGEVNPDANPFSFIADYLTSKPINLNYSPADSVYLSFFYQPQGKSYNGPEGKDSLTLEFKSPLYSTWKSIWRAEGLPNQPFRQVLIAIKDTSFLKAGFQFRFKNYGSIGDQQFPVSWRSNGDIWNIDWVKIDTARSIHDTVIDDVGIIYGSKSFLKDYESIPWPHYKLANDQQVDKFSMVYRNNSIQTRNIQRFVKHFDANNIADTTFNLGSENVSSYQLVDYTLNFNYNLFPYDSTRDSSSFLIKSYLIWDTVAIHKPYRWNDTTSYNQKFYDFYGYDDGTPESGYCVMGSSSAKVAYKYYTYKPDTLRAVQIYFNQTFNNASQKYFFLTVWDYNNGLPGNIVYSRIGLKPVYNGLNQFYNYLLDSIVIISDTFFIGWIQTTTDCLNAGFDFSRNTKSKTYYNITGAWEQSPFNGSLMIRAVFGKSIPAGISENKSEKLTLTIYPNPADDVINITLSQIAYSSMFIYNIEGQLLRNFNLPDRENKINIGFLPKGMYFIKIISKDKIHYGKFVRQ